MTAIGLFPDDIKWVQRIIFIALFTRIIQCHIPPQTHLELVRPVAKHLACQSWMLAQVVSIKIS